MENEKEFTVDTPVTVDRYNHISNPSKGIIVGYAEAPVSKTLLYQIDIDGCIIKTSGLSIVESKFYSPLSENERHGYDIKAQREKERLEDLAWFERTKMK
jgi:hypothetical protein